MKFFFFAFALPFCLLACKTKDKNVSTRSIEPDEVFYDYNIRAEDENDEATIILQYKTGEDGQPLNTGESVVLFDGTPLPQDSSRFLGPYYEQSLPLAELKNPHTIVFIDKNRKEHKEEFSVAPFTLATELPEKIKKQPFQIKLNGLPEAPVTIQLGMVDTSYTSTEVNEDVRVKNGILQIDSTLLTKLSTGPINLQIVRTEERPLKNPTKAGGRLVITYTLRRQFEFVD